MKNKKLEEAIKIVEEAGGFVMIADHAAPEEAPITESQLDAWESDLEEQKREFELRKEEAREDFHKMLGSKNCSYSSVEDMMLSHGLEMDYIEEFLY